MEHLFKNASLVQRAHWLIRLRWVAIAALVIATFFSGRFLHISLAASSLYVLGAILLVYNSILYVVARRVPAKSPQAAQPPSAGFTAEGGGATSRTVERLVAFQISADLLILTTILHFSGGIENPFSFFFVFHMIIASILCSMLQSYLQATLAVLLFGGLVILEAAGRLPHHALAGFAEHSLYASGTYVFGFLFVFSVTLYLVVYMTSSISEMLRRQQEDTERANAQLREQDHLKNEYVLRVTHDIKGHLAAIQSCLDVLLNGMLGTLNDKQQDFAERARRRTEKCLLFVTALLKLTHMKLSGGLEMELFSLRQAIFNALGLAGNRARDKGVTLSHQVDASIEQFQGEAVLIEETITNILYNAVKYTPAGGKVSLEVKDGGDAVTISVADTGIGIPPEAMPHIFEEFYRADNARAIERDGTGLGLAFAKQVVKRHGGRICAQNNPTSGATFTFTLPKTLAPAGRQSSGSIA
jgi:signal transduction histidine kinase